MKLSYFADRSCINQNIRVKPAFGWSEGWWSNIAAVHTNSRTWPCVKPSHGADMERVEWVNLETISYFAVPLFFVARHTVVFVFVCFLVPFCVHRSYLSKRSEARNLPESVIHNERSTWRQTTTLRPQRAENVRKFFLGKESLS